MLLHLAIVGAPPIMPSAFQAEVTVKTNGTMAGIPIGTQAFTMLYDFGNKRLRKDFADGTTKVYRYDEKVDPPQPVGPPKPGVPSLPTPVGYQFKTGSMRDCCWTWLYDADSGMADKMSEITIDPKAKDLGPDAAHAGTEHWQKRGWFPFPRVNDYYVSNSTLVRADTYLSIKSRGTVISNTTYDNVAAGPIDVSNFIHPTVNPSFPELGKCKQFGKDPLCHAGDGEQMRVDAMLSTREISSDAASA